MKSLLSLCIVLAAASLCFGQYVDRTQITKGVSTSATLQSAATANGNGTAFSIDGYAGLVLTVDCSSCSGGSTINFEASQDGTNYVSKFGSQLGTTTIASSATAAGVTVWYFGISGLKQFRARISNYSAGTVTVTATALVTSSPPEAANVNVASSVLPSNAATSTKQSDGSQKTQVVDGSGNVIGSTSNALDVNIKSGNPSTITVTQATATNLNADANLKNIAGSAVSTVASGVQRVGISDSGGTAFLSAANSLNSTGGGVLAVQVVAQFDDTSPTSITENQFGNVRMSANRNLYGTIRDAAGNERGANVDATNRLSVSVDNSNVSSNVAQINGTTVSMGNGASGTGVQRVTLANDSTGQVALATGSNTIGSLTANQSVNVAQINGVTPLMGNGGTGTGSPRVTIASDNTANSNPWLAQPVPGTANGASTCVLQSAASTNATNCKNAAGLLYGVEVVNTTSTIYYLRLYNSSSSPTCSSATGFVRTVPIPHGSGAGAGIANFYTVGETYGTGIGFCFTGGGSSTDNTNAATGVYITLHYK